MFGKGDGEVREEGGSEVSCTSPSSFLLGGKNKRKEEENEDILPHLNGLK